jgi:hypothetical protein
MALTLASTPSPHPLTRMCGAQPALTHPMGCMHASHALPCAHPSPACPSPACPQRKGIPVERAQLDAVMAAKSNDAPVELLTLLYGFIHGHDFE